MRQSHSSLRRTISATGGVYALLLAGMIRYQIAAGPPYDQATPELLVALALFAALVGLLAVWGAIAGVRWPRRVSASIFGIALLAGFWLLFFDWHPFLMWQLLVIFAVEIGCLIVVLGLARSIGYGLKSFDADIEAAEVSNIRATAKFSVSDLLVLTAAVAFLLMVLRLAEPVRLWPTLYWILVSGGCSAAIIALVTTWACMSPSPLVLRMLLVILVAPMGGAVYAVASRYGRLMFSWQWYAAVTTAQVLFMSGPMLFIRSHGCRVGFHAGERMPTSDSGSSPQGNAD
jgi:hypothetical protein